MSRFYIDVMLHVYWLLPNLLSNGTTIAWLTSLLAYIQHENNRFVDFAERYILYAKYNNQVGVHEKLLNHLFSPTSGIFITDGNPSNEISLYNWLEDIDSGVIIWNYAETPTIPEAYLWNFGEPLNTVDYIVNVPIADYTLFADQIIGVCNIYKPAGKTYKILTY